MKISNGVTMVVLFSLGLAHVEAWPSHPATKTLYLLEDKNHEQCCAFREEAEWKAEVESVSAMVVATADYVDARISALNITEQDEAGDWIVYDHYSLDENGIILKLKRTINVLSGDRSEDEVFPVVGGIAKKQSTASRKLSTGKPLSAPNDWLPKVPVVTRIQAFPFSPLAGSQSLEVWSKGKSCIQVSGR